jgi:hypothetical protein
MRYAVLLAAGAVLALSACQKSEEAAPEASASATPTPAATPVAAATPAGPAAFTAGQPPTKEFMVGTWGEGDACKDPIDFQADGTIKGGPLDTWTLTDGQLVMGDVFKINLKVVDGSTMEAVPDGSTDKKTLKRCGA